MGTPRAASMRASARPCGVQAPPRTADLAIGPVAGDVGDAAAAAAPEPGAPATCRPLLSGASQPGMTRAAGSTSARSVPVASATRLVRVLNSIALRKAIVLLPFTALTVRSVAGTSTGTFVLRVT